MVKAKVEKGKKLIFLKIRKQDESRWRQSEKVMQVIKDQAEKEIIDAIVFAPFKD